MKPMPDQFLETHRQVAKEVELAGGTPAGTGNGIFSVPFRGVRLHIISSVGDGWEHVSVSTNRRCPTWDEMCFAKNLFWGPAETVMQLHVPESDHVNNHPYCLHLWRPLDVEIPRPPTEFVGGGDRQPLNDRRARKLVKEAREAFE